MRHDHATSQTLSGSVMSDTVKEETEHRRIRRHHVLVHVMNYDDLLAPPMGLTLVDGSLLIGRREPGGVGLLLDDRRVSSRHLQLERRGAEVVATDLGSSNGTTINGSPLEGTHALRDGDLIEVGRSLLCYRLLEDLDFAREGWAWGAGRTFNAELGQLGAQLERIARSSEPVLILGETGAGKEIAARRVHQLSQRSGPLVSIDCGAMPESLVEATLFGHERGSFTGATEARVGDIARAHRGTLFLDEVGNLPLPTQAKLLRVLETRTVRPVGGRDGVEVDVRWVAATNAALTDETNFRSDLRFRLAGFVARLPPLRKRKEDLGLLVSALLKEAGVTAARASKGGARLLMTHSFPGNVRELRQILRAAAVLHKDGVVELAEDSFREAVEASTAKAKDDVIAAEPDAPLVPPPRMAAPAKEAIEQALRTAQGRVSVAAKLIGTSPRQLYRWIEKLELDPEAFRSL